MSGLHTQLGMGWGSPACALARFEALSDSWSLLLYCYLPHPQLDFPQVAHALLHPTALNPALCVSAQPPAAIFLFCSICPSTSAWDSLCFCPQQADESLNFEEQILEAAKSIAAATSALVKAASAAQRELVAQGKVRP